MTTLPEHPSLNLRVNEEQRDRATAWLQQAYAEGRITEDEFDTRIGTVLTAQTRRELNLAFYGLVDTPRAAVTVAQSLPQRRGGSESTVLGLIGWFGSLVALFVAPLVTYVISGRGTLNRRISADALNFQILSLIVFAIGGVFSDFIGILGPATAIYGVLWVVITIIGGVKAANGEPWANPVNRLTRFNPVKP